MERNPRKGSPFLEGQATMNSRNGWKQTQINAKWGKDIIANTFPEADGQVRVADLETQDGIVRRPITKSPETKTI